MPALKLCAFGRVTSSLCPLSLLQNGGSNSEQEINSYLQGTQNNMWLTGSITQAFVN